MHRPGRRAKGWPLALLCLAVVAAGCQWPMAGFDAAHTSFNPFEDRIDIANVTSLQLAWTASLGPEGAETVPPVVSNGFVFAAGKTFPFTVQAFDDDGVVGCAGNPKTCAPLWTGTTVGGAAVSLGAAGGLLFVGTGGDQLNAFDAAGVAGCTGTPRVCRPLWTASGIDGRSVVATGEHVYASDPSGSTLFAFDAAGVDGCSGTPTTCVPVWTASPGGLPSVANGVVYVSSAGHVAAFDARGMQGCSGAPKTCAPLWTAHEPGAGGIFTASTVPVVAQGLVFIGVSSGDETFFDGSLVAFDAAGTRGCSGTPKTCVAIWRAPTDGVANPPAVAGDRLYVVDRFFDEFAAVGRSALRAFDVDACSTSRPPCEPLWIAPGPGSGVIVANGVVYSRFAAYDAAGNVGCTGLPRRCAPVVTSPSSGDASMPVATRGTAYRVDGTLQAFTLP